MPHAVMSTAEIDSVAHYSHVIRGLLQTAQRIKPARTIEPALTYADVAEEAQNSIKSDDENALSSSQSTKHAAVETAFRNVFYDLIVRLCFYLESRKERLANRICLGQHTNR